jgi:hypothetical protein
MDLRADTHSAWGDRWTEVPRGIRIAEVVGEAREAEE